jgi:hypothetical protein
MEKEFCTYEQALALKKLGFDEPCFAFYQVEYTESKPTMVDDDREYRVTGYRTCKNSQIPEHYTAAPTFSQAFRWFREKQKLHGSINLSESVVGMYSWEIMDDSLNRIGHTPYYSFEEAEIACLDKLIEMIAKKQKSFYETA